MRSFNKARLIDIADKGLDPQQHHVVGADGRLASNLPLEKDSQVDVPSDEKDADPQTSIVQEQKQVIFAQTATSVEKKSKNTKSTKKSN